MFYLAGLLSLTAHHLIEHHMNKIKNTKTFLAGILLIYMLMLVSCNKDNDPASSQTPTNEQNAYVNKWILENLQYYYLWKDNLKSGADVNSDPETYFKSLLYSGDRFSWIQDNYQELLNSLKGVSKEAGFEFTLYKKDKNSDAVIAQIVYVKPGSPAETAGLVRGDVISAVNGTNFSVSNYLNLIDQMKQNYTVTYQSVDPETQIFTADKTASLTVTEYSEDPNFMHKVIQNGNHKIGYYVYNLFSDGPTSNSQVYDDEMDAIFADFKSQGITDMVLDLRFNSGGAETASANLASNIGTGVNSSKVFAKKEYNPVVEQDIKNDPQLGESFLTRNFSDKASNVGSMLNNNRVYVLTSHRSASASELVINALKPYMDVFIIGDTTYGKNVGSISLYQENDPKNNWGMQPIIVKVFNSLGQSDYSEGFVPNVVQLDNSLYLYPLGDEHEILLAHAIGQITGTSTMGRTSQQPGEIEIGHSIDQKRRSFNLIVDSPLKR
jgi:carboxyl-terminal processing protease